jgi:hypothetical protein
MKQLLFIFRASLRAGHSRRCRGIGSIRFVIEFDAEKNWRFCKKLLTTFICHQKNGRDTLKKSHISQT